MKILNRMLGRSADVSFISDNDAIRQFTDLTDTYWAYYEIMETTNGHGYRLTDSGESWTKLLK